jgi:hypothetical protein
MTSGVLPGKAMQGGMRVPTSTRQGTFGDAVSQQDVTAGQIWVWCLTCCHYSQKDRSGLEVFPIATKMFGRYNM